MIRIFRRFTVAVVILATAFQATPTFATPLDSPVTQDHIDATQEQIHEFETKIQQLDNRIIEAMEKSKKISEEIKKQEGKIEETEDEIEKAKKDLNVHQSILSERMKTIQLDGKQSIMIYAETLLSSENMSEFFSRFIAISQIIQSDTELISGLNEKQRVLEEAEETFHKEYEKLKKSQEELASEQKRIAEDKKKIEKALAEVKIKLQNQQEQHAQQEAERRAELARQEAERQAQLAQQESERQVQSSQESVEQPDQSVQQPAQQTSQTPQQSSIEKPVESTPVANPSNLTNSETANKVIATAKQYLGVPYVWGGTSPSGFDCSGFVQYVYRSVGVSLPRVSRDQQNVGTRISPSQVQPGDLVFNGSPAYHVGIYIGGGQYIHAPQTGDVVRIMPYNPSKFSSAARVLH